MIAYASWVLAKLILPCWGSALSEKIFGGGKRLAEGQIAMSLKEVRFLVGSGLIMNDTSQPGCTEGRPGTVCKVPYPDA